MKQMLNTLNISDFISKCTNYIYNTYFIVVTWARVVCLICLPKAQGPQARGLKVDISGRSQVPMLQLLCNTS